MLTTLLFTFACALPAQDQPKPAADPKRIDAAVAELTTAFGKDGTSETRMAAIKNSTEVVDGKVIAMIVKGIDDKDPQVESAAIDALGHMAHPDSLKALHSLYKKDKSKLKDDEQMFPLLLRSIARQGSPTSVEILLDDPFSQRKHDAIRARILGLGNIRSKSAVEGLVSFLSLAGAQKVDGYMDDFRLAFGRLTGQDKGPDPAQWQKWWQDSKDKFEVPAALPDLPPEQKRTWNRYWGGGKRDKDGNEAGEEGGKRKKGEGKGEGKGDGKGEGKGKGDGKGDGKDGGRR